MASIKHIDLSSDIGPNIYEDVPLSPMEPRKHPNAGQAASSGAAVSSVPTQWKLKHQMFRSSRITVKNANGEAVQLIKVKGVVKTKLTLLDLQTGETLAVCKSNSTGRKGKIYFFDGIVYATMISKGADHRRWEIQTPDETYHVKPSSVFSSNFEVLLGRSKSEPDVNVVATVQTKFTSSKVNIMAGQDVPFLLICFAFVDFLNRKHQPYG
jgi:hypothetical protein